MTHWTVCDRNVADLVMAIAGPEAELQTSAISREQALEVALACPPAVALLPSPVPGHTCVVQITRHRVQVPMSVEPRVPAPMTVQPSERAHEPEPRSTASYVAGGFLGLADEVVLETEPEKPKKWWQKLLD